MPVELAANAIGLAAFGLHVVDILNKYLSSFKNAEKRMNAILYDTKLITAVLQQFKEHVDEESEVHMSREARDIAEDAFDRCSNVFKDIYTALVDGEPPSPSVDGSFRSHDVSKISFRKRIGWHFLEPKLELHRTNLDRIKTTLQLLTSVTTWGVLRKLCPDVSKVVNQKEKEIAALTEAARTAVKRADDLEKEHEAQQRKVLQNTKADSEAQGGIKPDTPPYERAGSSTAVLSRTYSAQGNDVTLSKIPHLLHGEAKAATRENKASASICSSTGKGLQKRPSPGDTRSPFHVMMVKPPFSRGPGLTVSAHPQNQDRNSGALVSTAEDPTLDAPNLRDGGSPPTSRSLTNLTPSTPGSTTEDSSIRETEPRNIHKPTQCENNALEDDPVLKTILNSLRDQYAFKAEFSEDLKSIFETALIKIHTYSSSGDKPKRTCTTPLPDLSLADVARAIDLADTQAEKLVKYITAASASKRPYRKSLGHYIECRKSLSESVASDDPAHRRNQSTNTNSILLQVVNRLRASDSDSGLPRDGSQWRTLSDRPRAFFRTDRNDRRHRHDTAINDKDSASPPQPGPATSPRTFVTTPSGRHTSRPGEASFAGYSGRGASPPEDGPASCRFAQSNSTEQDNAEHDDQARNTVPKPTRQLGNSLPLLGTTSQASNDEWQSGHLEEPTYLSPGQEEEEMASSNWKRITRGPDDLAFGDFENTLEGSAEHLLARLTDFYD